VMSGNLARLSSGQFSPVAAGRPAEIITLAVAGTGAGRSLYAGGLFTTLNGTLVNGVARWTGSGWAPLGGGVQGMVRSITHLDEPSGTSIVVAGVFEKAGTAGVSVQNVAKWDGHAWSIGPSLSLPIFAGGRNRANYKRSQAAYQEAVAHYRQQVLVAFGEVENSLSAIRHLINQAAAQQRAVANARRAADLATDRYRSGIVSYLEVVDASREALSADRANAIRKILEEEGVPTASFFMVAGRADTQPLFPDDPFVAANRRVTITLVQEASPLPPMLKP